MTRSDSDAFCCGHESRFWPKADTYRWQYQKWLLPNWPVLAYTLNWVRSEFSLTALSYSCLEMAMQRSEG